MSNRSQKSKQPSKPAVYRTVNQVQNATKSQPLTDQKNLEDDYRTKLAEMKKMRDAMGNQVIGTSSRREEVGIVPFVTTSKATKIQAIILDNDLKSKADSQRSTSRVELTAMTTIIDANGKKIFSVSSFPKIMDHKIASEYTRDMVINGLIYSSMYKTDAKFWWCDDQMLKASKENLSFQNFEINDDILEKAPVLKDYLSTYIDGLAKINSNKPIQYYEEMKLKYASFIDLMLTTINRNENNVHDVKELSTEHVIRDSEKNDESVLEKEILVEKVDEVIKTQEKNQMIVKDEGNEGKNGEKSEVDKKEEKIMEKEEMEEEKRSEKKEEKIEKKEKMEKKDAAITLSSNDLIPLRTYKLMNGNEKDMDDAIVEASNLSRNDVPNLIKSDDEIKKIEELQNQEHLKRESHLNNYFDGKTEKLDFNIVDKISWSDDSNLKEYKELKKYLPLDVEYDMSNVNILEKQNDISNKQDLLSVLPEDGSVAEALSSCVHYFVADLEDWISAFKLTSPTKAFTKKSFDIELNFDDLFSRKEILISAINESTQLKESLMFILLSDDSRTPVKGWARPPRHWDTINIPLYLETSGTKGYFHKMQLAVYSQWMTKGISVEDAQPGRVISRLDQYFGSANLCLKLVSRQLSRSLEESKDKAALSVTIAMSTCEALTIVKGGGTNVIRDTMRDFQSLLRTQERYELKLQSEIANLLGAREEEAANRKIYIERNVITYQQRDDLLNEINRLRLVISDLKKHDLPKPLSYADVTQKEKVDVKNIEKEKVMDELSQKHERLRQKTRDMHLEISNLQKELQEMKDVQCDMKKEKDELKKLLELCDEKAETNRKRFEKEEKLLFDKNIEMSESIAKYEENEKNLREQLQESNTLILKLKKVDFAKKDEKYEDLFKEKERIMRELSDQLKEKDRQILILQGKMDKLEKMGKEEKRGEEDDVENLDIIVDEKRKGIIVGGEKGSSHQLDHDSLKTLVRDETCRKSRFEWNVNKICENIETETRSKEDLIGNLMTLMLENSVILSKGSINEIIEIFASLSSRTVLHIHNLFMAGGRIFEFVMYDGKGNLRSLFEDLGNDENAEIRYHLVAKCFGSIPLSCEQKLAVM